MRWRAGLVILGLSALALTLLSSLTEGFQGGGMAHDVAWNAEKMWRPRVEGPREPGEPAVNRMAWSRETMPVPAGAAFAPRNI
jgi:hypothetical protein